MLRVGGVKFLNEVKMGGKFFKTIKTAGPRGGKRFQIFKFSTSVYW